jgi:hypothetical protein
LGRGFLRVGDGQGENDGAGEQEKDASPEMRKDSHHLKLYSEYVGRRFVADSE